MKYQVLKYQYNIYTIHDSTADVAISLLVKVNSSDNLAITAIFHNNSEAIPLS